MRALRGIHDELQNGDAMKEKPSASQILALVTLCTCAVGSVGRASDLPKVAVMPLSGERVPVATRRLLDELVVTALAEVGGYAVISTADVQAMLGYEKLKDAVGCDDVACFAEVGGALGAEFLLAGQVGPLGDELIVSLRMIEARNHTVAFRGQAKVPNQESEYARAIEEAVFAMFPIQPGVSRIAEREKPWVRAGISKSQWGKYEAFVKAARTAEYPIPKPQQWVRRELKDHETWMRYLHYRSQAMDVQFEPAAFASWQQQVLPESGDWSSYFAYRSAQLAVGEDSLDFGQWRHEIFLGRIAISSTPQGATVLLNGEPMGKTVTTVTGLRAGKYQVRIELEAHLPQEDTVDVHLGKERTISFELVRLDLVDAAAASYHSKTLWGWVSLGAAVVLTGSAGYVYGRTRGASAIRNREYAAFLAASNESDAVETHNKLAAAVDSHNRAVNWGYALGGAAALALGFSVFEFMTRPDPEIFSGVGVSMTPGGGVLSLGGSL